MSKQVALLFPGQGSQSMGMLSDFAEFEPEIKETFEFASQILAYDLWDVVQCGPEETLNLTTYTQPALLVAGVAIWNILKSHSGISPKFLAGHSLGEYTALVCSGAIEFESAIRLVSARGRLMQEAVPKNDGAMAAIIGMPEESIQKICREVSVEENLVEIANFNSPEQQVISGHRTGIEKALELASKMGARKSVMLPVSVPSHCSLMRTAADLLSEPIFNTHITLPRIPVFCNVDATIKSETSEIKEVLIHQLYQPVWWYKIINSMLTEEVDAFVECGPGRVLTGLNKRICPKDISTLPTSNADNIKKVIDYVS